MNSIKDAIVFVNIKGENGMREVREARFTKIQTEPCHISLYKDMVYSFDGDFKIEIAGLGEMTNNGLLSLDGYLYSNMEDALNQQDEIASHHTNNPSVNLLWAKINVSDLNFKHKSMSVSIPCPSSCRPFHAYSWYWDGTRAVRECVNRERKFYYDFLENRIVEYGNSKIDSLGTLYATAEACKKANTPKIVRFNAKPKKCEVVVRFEITKKVTLTDDCDECEAILQGVKMIKSMSEDELYDECTEYYQK